MLASDGVAVAAVVDMQHNIQYITLDKKKTKERKKSYVDPNAVHSNFFSSFFFFYFFVAVVGQEDTSKLLSLKQHSGFLDVDVYIYMYVVCRITTQNTRHTDRRRSPVRCILKLNKSEKLQPTC